MQHLVQYTVLTSVMARATTRARHLDTDLRRRPDEPLTGCRHVTAQEVDLP
ncbi:hypothetical protein [Promicromonospora sp. NPDC050880]|uniref:hypothetical protein n=1 Tax=Promicromonospora sp. NPDC050880 TaxID=3364406 RepID=UPI00378DB025